MVLPDENISPRATLHIAAYGMKKRLAVINVCNPTACDHSRTRDQCHVL